jgi:hypothetical protein
MTHGRFCVAESDGTVLGYGGTEQLGQGERAVSMLTDLFVHPDAHGRGVGRAILTELWQAAPRRMTFSSLHASALPLYTSFGTAAWWPLLYLTGDVRALPAPAGWSVSASEPVAVAALERDWTGLDRLAGHRLWASWPDGACVVASLGGEPMAAGSTGGAGMEFGISHLAVAPALDDDQARDAVLAVLSWLDPGQHGVRVCLPAPHPATRALLGAGWRVSEYDLHMASEFGLIDPRRAVPSAALA